VEATSELIGRVFQDRFVITDLLGEGGMGVVYRGFEQATMNEVAIKVLQPRLAADPMILARFHREASAGRKISHANAVRVLGRGEQDGMPFIVMEYVDGRSLYAVLAESGRLDQARAARILIQVCGALAVAHERGIVHRDLKPENIMVLVGGEVLGERVKLLDFGVAKRVERSIEDSYSTGEVTTCGAIVGTPDYMAPEQCMAQTIDARADVYACGVLLYELVTGRLPFRSEDAMRVCQMHIADQPPAPRSLFAAIDARIEATILRALRKDPGERQQSAAELRDELLAALEHLTDGVETAPTQRFSLSEIDPEVMAQAAELMKEPAARMAVTMIAEVPVSSGSPVGVPGAPVAEPAAAPVPAVAPAARVAPPARRPLSPTIVAKPVEIEIEDESTARGTVVRRAPKSWRVHLPAIAFYGAVGAGLATLAMSISALLHL
jgi:serine/threonine-protein kinase